MKKIILILCLPFLLIGCTPGKLDQPYDSYTRQGYKNIQLAENKYRIMVFGGKKDSYDDALNFLYMHTAELALKHNYDFFIVDSFNGYDVTTTSTTLYWGGPTDKEEKITVQAELTMDVSFYRDGDDIESNEAFYAQKLLDNINAYKTQEKE